MAAHDRLYAWLVTLPPFAWIALFLFTPIACSFVTASGAWTRASKCSTMQRLQIICTWPPRRSTSPSFSAPCALPSRWYCYRCSIGYPLACFLVFQAGKYRRMLYQAVIIPLWVSYLVRAYAWKVIFGNEGVMNTLLLWCHATRHPLGFLLYSPFAVIVTLTHIYVPFVVLPVVASLEKIPPELLESSSDLGATAWQTLPG